MSLINDLLNDLEKRQVKDSVSPEEETLHGLKAVKYRSVKGRTFLRFLVLLLLFALVSFGLLFFFSWHLASSSALTIDLPIVQEAEPETPESMAPAEEIQPPEVLNQLQSIDLVTSDLETTVVFHLENAAWYAFEMSNDQRQLIFWLPETTLSPLLQIPSGTGLPSLTVEAIGNGIRLTLTLPTDTTIQTLGGTEVAPFSITLSLAYPKTAVETMAGQEIVKLETPLSPEEKANIAHKQALDSLSKNDIPQTITLLESSLRELPSLAPARMLLAMLLMQQKRYEVAQVTLEKGLDIHPHSVELTQLYAQLQVERGQWDKATKALERLSPDIAQYPEYYALMANVYQHTGRFLLAAQLYEELLNQDEGNGRWWMGLGIALESSGNLNSAIYAYKQAITTNRLTPSVEAYAKKRIAQLGG